MDQDLCIVSAPPGESSVDHLLRVSPVAATGHAPPGASVLYTGSVSRLRPGRAWRSQSCLCADPGSRAAAHGQLVGRWTGRTVRRCEGHSRARWADISVVGRGIKVGSASTSTDAIAPNVHEGHPSVSSRLYRLEEYPTRPKSASTPSGRTRGQAQPATLHRIRLKPNRFPHGVSPMMPGTWRTSHLVLNS